MALVLKALYNGYDRYFCEAQDPRNADNFLMNPPWVPVGIVAVYLYFVLKLGPRWMANRKPFDLKKLILIYNILQVLANLYLCIEGVRVAVAMRISLTCQPVDYSNHPLALRELKLVHLYYLLKVSDLIDTVFFVLRKKQSHVTFLHVYHHSAIMFGSYICNRFFPGGHFSMLGLCNTLVHAVMYFYFFLTVYRPDLTKNANWKKYITLLQMVQFAYLVFHFGTPIAFGLDCAIPKFWLGLPLIQNVFMMVLFWDFYTKAYGRRKIK
ncbi:elongation of very long chain fatty acids protein AAEL008004-like [Armigeres subalbatus]|uniref:elongation of very long chain fatty acids protein AAEL008004-like n=1 Tax=Armigeres subalbatus TaxID=124917 RepID=UPI002ED28873